VFVLTPATAGLLLLKKEVVKAGIKKDCAGGEHGKNGH
jgi:hypothetical protein